MIPTTQDRLRHAETGTAFAGICNSAIMVSPNIRLCMTTTSGSSRSDLAARRDIPEPQGVEMADEPVTEAASDLNLPV
jgi:hypothetical protein